MQKMKIIVRSAAILIAAVAVAGCAPMISGTMNLSVDEDVLQTKTAKYFNTDKVKITDMDKQALSTSYRAQHKGINYNCKLYYGEVTCKRPGA